MKRMDYRGNLLNFVKRRKIEHPTKEDVAGLCPHLCEDQICEIFDKVNNGKSAYFAAPPIKVRTAFQILTVDPPYKSDTSDRPVRLSWSYAGRIDSGFASYAFADDAMLFADQHWGDELVEDTWKDYIDFYLDDPSDLDKNRNPATKLIIGVGLNQGFNEIMNDRSAPKNELIRDSVVIASTCVLTKHEMKGGRGGYAEFNCAYCGSGLSLCRCCGCGHNFHDNQLRSGWDTPLPTNLISIAREAGWEFKQDPQIAIDTERTSWRNNYRAHA